MLINFADKQFSKLKLKKILKQLKAKFAMYSTCQNLYNIW